MPPEAFAFGARQRLWQSVPQAWRVPLVRSALAWLVLLAAFLPDWRDMAAQWWNISTYNHILLVPAIIVWLVWLRTPALAALEPHGWWPGLVVFAGAALLWVLGDFAGVSLARQLGVVVMAQAVALALLGPRTGAALAFPLGYMLFMVPFGDEAVPLLQLVTAELTMALLALWGLPALLDGVFITTPTGYFEVAEACSGVKFLVAMIAYGALVANVCFRATSRRLAFMALALVVPILANGVRAWGTIVIAHYRGIEFASSFDHILYGWVFFALVMALVMALAWPFFDRGIDEPMVDAEAIQRSRPVAWLARFRSRGNAVLATMAAVIVAALAWAAAAATLEAKVPPQLYLPEVPGWVQVDYAPDAWWEPRRSGADHRLLGRYRDAEGNTVDVSFALYSSQREGREAGGFGEGALTPDSAWAWVRPEPGIAGGLGDRLQAPGPVDRLAVTWYRTGALTTASNLRLKLAGIENRLRLRARPTSALILSAEESPGHPAEASIRAFLDAAGPPSRWMDRIAAGR